MSTHPDLGGLLRGALSNDEILTIVDHVSGCDSCRHDLVDVAAGHALLASASRVLGRTPAAVPPLPTPLPAPATRLGRLGRETRPAVGRRRIAAVGGIAAAVTLAAVGGLAIGRSLDDSGVGSPPQPDQVAVLEPVTGQATGKVAMTATSTAVTRMSVDAADLPRARRGQFYYVWLFDPETNKMLPLGQIGPSGRADFELPVALLDEYTAIDVSLERDDGDPGHSVTSVLRASYAAPGASAT